MIGYGFLNSKLQEFCINGLINNFFKRSTQFLLFTYADLRYKAQIERGEPDPGILSFDNKIVSDITQKLFIIFLQEEKSVGTDEDIYKYILSSNIIKDKDYSFDSKTAQTTFEEGISKLKDIFIEQLNLFLLNTFIKERIQSEIIATYNKPDKGPTGIKFNGYQIEVIGTEKFDPKKYTDLYNKLYIEYITKEGKKALENYYKETLTSINKIINHYKAADSLKERQLYMSYLDKQIYVLEVEK